MSGRVRAKVSLSIAAYQHSRLEQVDTEAVSIQDAERNVVLEITPYPSHGIAQVVTMTPEQSREGRRIFKVTVEDTQGSRRGKATP